MVMMASLNTVCVHITMRIGVHVVGDLLKLQITPGFSMTKFYDQCRGSRSDRKFKVTVEGVKFTTGFWRYRPKHLLFELTTRKSRTLGVDQKFLTFWRPRYFICSYPSYPSECCQTSSSLPAWSWHPPVDTAECNQPSGPRRRSTGSTSGQGPSWTQSLLATEVSTASHVVPQLPAPSARVAAAEAWWRVCRGVNWRSKAPATPASDIKLASPNSPHSKAWL